MRAFDQRFASVYNDLGRFPSLEHVAQEMGVSVKTVRNRAGEMRQLRDSGLDVPELVSRVGTGRGQTPLKATASDEPEIEFRERELIEPLKRPVGNKTRYFILSSVQDETNVHHGFLDNLEAYAKWLGNCEILLAGFTYNKTVFTDEPRPESKKIGAHHFHERTRKYLTHDQIQLGDSIVFCGEMNTLPTAVTPLSGFETYTKGRWGIFPHPKVQLQAVATAKKSPTKQLMTTGAVSMPNYVQKKAGIKASFHHEVGAVIVEVHPDGAFFCRHIQADGLGADEGGFYDLDRRVERGHIDIGHAVEALNYGDIHHEKLDPEVALTTWGYDVENGTVIARGNTLVDRLKPRHQFFHDLSDFSARNHHNIKDPHFIFRTRQTGNESVEEQLMGCAIFLDRTKREGTRSVVVQSNHDNALLRWLKTADYREDPANALFFLQTQTLYYEQLNEGADDVPIFEMVLREFITDSLAGVTFVSEDDSYVICGDIECAMHGHLGANGARGNPRQYTRMGMKSNTGHTHSPYMADGAVVAGVSAKLDLGYNKGLSSWDHAHIVTYPNGKRAILTMKEGRWFGGAKRGRRKT